MPLHKPAAWLFALAALAFTCDASYLQLQIGRESAEILPLARSVTPQRQVVAITLDASSHYLHPMFFYLMHRHDIFYYQIASGAGSPHLWNLPLLPVQYRGGAKPAYPSSVPELVQQGYSLVFVRGLDAQLAEALDAAFVERQVSGAWTVFERRPAPHASRARDAGHRAAQ